MDKMKQERQLKDLQAKRDEVFKEYQNDKSNPYWYEDWGCIIDDLDEQIAAIKKKLVIGNDESRKQKASNMYVPTLGEMRPLLDKVARYSVCMQETLNYENYRSLKDVPEEYDPLYIYGIGMIETEFYEHQEEALDDFPYDDPSGNLRMSESTDWRPHLRFRDAIELMLSKKPRKE